MVIAFEVLAIAALEALAAEKRWGEEEGEEEEEGGQERGVRRREENGRVVVFLVDHAYDGPGVGGEIVIRPFETYSSLSARAPHHPLADTVPSSRISALPDFFPGGILTVSRCLRSGVVGITITARSSR